MRLDTRRRRRSAATLVESAFVISIFLILLFGIFEYGRFVMTKQIMDNAARDGARYAAINTDTATTADVQNYVDTKLSMGRNQLVGYVKTTNITVFAADASGNPIGGATWQDVAFGATIGVKITGTYHPSLPSFLHMSSSITVTAKSCMQSEAN